MKKLIRLSNKGKCVCDRDKTHLVPYGQAEWICPACNAIYRNLQDRALVGNKPRFDVWKA